jgi:predicted dehydrogenase
MAVTSMRFGLIGTGFMGKAHAIALRTVGTVFPEVPAPELSLLVDSNLDKASADAVAWGFARAGSDWRAVCRDPDIERCVPVFQPFPKRHGGSVPIYQFRFTV